MANLSAKQSAMKNTINVNRSISHKTPQSFKPICDTVYNSHNHSHNKFSHDHCNINKFTVLHQSIWGISNKVDEFLS
jgi:hypothetical protein